MNWMRKFELLVQRLRRRTFDSASKDHWFCIRHLARALKCGPIRLEQTLASLLTAGAIASILLWHPLAFSPGILAFTYVGSINLNK